MNTAMGSAVAGTDFGRLKSRAQFAKTATLVTIALFAVVLLGQIGELVGVINLDVLELSPLAWIYAIASLASIAAFIVSAIAISMWIYRAHSSLREAGREDLQFSPGWAVGWYFIPLANLVMPFKAMRELWNESHLSADSYGGEAPGNLGVWWGTWIIGGILGNASLRLSLMGDGSNVQIAMILAALSSVLSIAAGYLIYQIIQSVTEAQEFNLGAVQTFE